MTQITDRMDLGYFPLQDHAAGVDGTSVSARQSLGGARISQMSDPSGGDAQVLYGVENQLGTIGDIHPWLFWQTRNRTDRGMGAWQAVFGGLIVDTDPYYGSTAIQPVRDGDWKNDSRFMRKTPSIAEGLSRLPAGALVLMVPGTAEEGQHDLPFLADGRLFAPHAAGPGDMGTLVCDFGPAGKICMANSEEPGIGGRHARLQTIFRVIAVPKSSGFADLGGVGNTVALNFSTTWQDGIANYGATFAPCTDGGPITPGSSTDTGSGAQSEGGSGGGESNLSNALRGRSSGSTENGGDGFGSFLPSAGSGDEKTPRQFGVFSPKTRGGHAIGLLESMVGFGPIHAGAGRDKHQLGVDADGHPIQSSHIGTGAYFFRDRDQDAPLEFGGGYPNPPGWPLRARTHLGYDQFSMHPHAKGPRHGLWRWWTEVPYVAPGGPSTPPPVIHPPGGPTTPGPGGGRPPAPGGPSTPGPGRPGRRPPGGPGTGGPGGPRTPGPGGPTTPGPGGGGGPVIMPGPPIFPQPGPDLTGLTGAKGYPIGGNPGTTTGGDGTGGGGDGICTESDVAAQKSLDGAGSTGSHNFGEYGPTMSQLAMLGNGERYAEWSTYIGSGGQTGTTWQDLRDQLGRWSGRDPWTRLVEVVPGLIETVGSAAHGMIGAYVIHHPLHESFAALSFRPQLTVDKYPNFERNSQIHAGMILRDEERRPHAITVRAFGSQENGDWTYTEKPETSRARGGTTNGGILFAPPRFELADYLDVGSAVLDVEDTTSSSATTSHICAAPGVRFALGKPTSTGGLDTGGITFWQDISANNHAAIIDQNGSELFAGYDDGTDVIVRIGQGGSAAVVIPHGPSGDRPATPAAGMLRIITGGVADTLELWDSATSAWTAVTGGGGGGGLSDGDYGDIIVSGGGTAMAFDSAVVTTFARTFLDDVDAAAVRTTLGLGSLAVLSTVNDGNWSGTDLAVANGGTGSSTAAGARTNLGLGSLAVLSTIDGSLWSGTDLAVVDGGTGSSTASGARTNLGLVIGTDVQAYDAELAAIAGLVSAADKLPYFTGSGTAALTAFPAEGRTLVGLASNATQRGYLGIYRIWEDFAADPYGGGSTLSGGSGNAYVQAIGGKSWMADGTTQGVFAATHGSGSASTDASCRYSQPALYLQDASEFAFRIGHSNSTSCLYRFGLRAEAPTNAYDDVTDGCYFELNTSVSSNWYGCSASAGSRTKTTTGYAGSSSTTAWVWFRVKFANSTTGVTFSRWDSGTNAWVDLLTVATNIPASGTTRTARWFMQTVGNGGTFREIYIDAWATDPAQTGGPGSVPILD